MVKHPYSLLRKETCPQRQIETERLGSIIVFTLSCAVSQLTNHEYIEVGGQGKVGG